MFGNPFFNQRQSVPRGYGYSYPQQYRQPQYYDDDEEDEYEQQYENPYQAEMRRRHALQQQEQLKRKEMARRKQLLEQQQREREEQRMLRLQQEQLRRQEELRLREAALQQKREEERLKKEAELKQKLEWQAKQNDPQVREAASTLIQSLFRGKTERNNRVIQRLKDLSKVSTQIENAIEKDHPFIQEQIDNPPKELLEQFDEEEKKENKDKLWRTAAFEEKLTKGLLDLDGISAGKSEFVRGCRKELVNRINSELQIVDGVKKMLMVRRKTIQEKEELETSKRNMEKAEAELQKEMEGMNVEEKEEGRPIQTDSSEEGAVHEGIEEMEEEAKQSSSFVQEENSSTDKIQEGGGENVEQELEKETLPIVEEPEEVKETSPATEEQIESPIPLEEDFIHLKQEEKSNPSNDQLLKMIEELKRELKEKDSIIEGLRHQLAEKVTQPVPSQ